MTSEKDAITDVVVAVWESTDRTISHLVRGNVALAYEEVCALRELQLRLLDILLGEAAATN